MMPLASSTLTRRRQADGDSEMASARSTLAIRPSRCSLVTMARSTLSGGCSGIKPSLRCLRRKFVACRGGSGGIFAIAFEAISGRFQAMTRRYANQADSPNLTTARGAALYIGALLGPGLLLLPGLAAAEAGPASIVAWLALLGLSGLFAAVFSALGRRFPQAGGVIGYVAAGLGPRAGQAAGWSFLIGVVGGAPIVCLIGAGYVTGLTGGGHTARAAIAAALLLAVLGWAAVGPLTTRFANPQRQLPPVIAIALAVTTALYLGLAVATIGVLGPGAATSVPLADLLGRAVGSAGPGGAGGAGGARFPRGDRGGRRAADHAVRAPAGERRRAGDRADRAVPGRLSRQHGLGRPRAARTGSPRRRPRGAGRLGHAGLLRLGPRAPGNHRTGVQLAAAEGPSHRDRRHRDRWHRDRWYRDRWHRAGMPARLRRRVRRRRVAVRYTPNVGLS